MLSNYGLIQVLRVEADMKGTIRLRGLCEGRYQLGGLGDRCYHSLGDHVIGGALSLLLVLYGYLPPSVLDWGYVRISPDGIYTGYVANCIKQAQEGMFEGNYLPGCCIGGNGWLSQVGLMGLKS